MIKEIITQKIYTFPDRKLYGEYCLLSLTKLRLQIVKGEIKEQLCFIDSNDRAHVYDRFGIPDAFSKECIEEIWSETTMELLKEQMKIRRSELEQPTPKHHNIEHNGYNYGITQTF